MHMKFFLKKGQGRRCQLFQYNRRRYTVPFTFRVPVIFRLRLDSSKKTPLSHFAYFRPSSAWQTQDIAPSSNGISIPTEGLTSGGPMVTDEPNWGGGRSPGRDRNGDAPRRSSRSRSPGPPRDTERGSVSLLSPPFFVTLGLPTRIETHSFTAQTLVTICMSRVSVTKLTPEILSLPLQKLAECVSVHCTFSFLFVVDTSFPFCV